MQSAAKTFRESVFYQAIAGQMAHNLCQKNREALSKAGAVPLVLKAGYTGHTGIIFQGDMQSCTHLKKGPTRKTVLATGDGAAAIQTARIKKSFAKGTPD